MGVIYKGGVAYGGSASSAEVEDNSISINKLDQNLKDKIDTFIDKDNAVLSIVTADTDEYAKTYQFYQGEQKEENLIGSVNIPKDLVVSSGEVVTLAENEVEGKAAGKYIKLTLNNNDVLYISFVDLLADLDKKYALKEVSDKMQLDIIDLQRKGFADIKSYGAKGDGTTDDTQAFKDAVADCQESGRMLFLSKGTYLITDRIIIDKPITIWGASIDNSIVNFRNNTTHAETQYDADYWVESNAAFIVKGDNSIITNFTLNGGIKDAPSAYNGIVFHYPKQGATRMAYESAQRVLVQQMRIQGFKNGIFIYAGWNRFINTCEIESCSDSGIKYEPLEPDVVGSWAASGDSIMSCQMVGNKYGYYAKNNFQSLVQNCVFEYNEHAFYAESCQNVTFKNCWNEANTDKIIIKGSSILEGGYNININTVEHTPMSSNDVVTISTPSLITTYRGTNLVFKQEAGVITKGVDIKDEVSNLITNPTFSDYSGGTTIVPSSNGWNLYTQWKCSIDTEHQYGESNALKVAAEGETNEQAFGARQVVKIPDATHTYTISFVAQTPDRAALDSANKDTEAGMRVFLAYKNAEGTVSMFNNQTVDFIGNNAWEEKKVVINDLPADTTQIEVGFGIAKNGTVYIAAPMMVDNDNMTSSDVHFKVADEDNKLDILSAAGAKLGQIPMKTPKIEILENDISDEYISNMNDGDIAIIYNMYEYLASWGDNEAKDNDKGFGLETENDDEITDNGQGFELETD